jgi:hypothetical protein
VWLAASLINHGLNSVCLQIGLLMFFVPLLAALLPAFIILAGISLVRRVQLLVQTKVRSELNCTELGHTVL